MQRLGILWNPFIGYPHEISIHRGRKSLAVIPRLNDSWFSLSCQHSHRLAQPLNPLHRVVLTQVIDDANNNFTGNFVESNKNRVVDHLNNTKK